MMASLMAHCFRSGPVCFICPRHGSKPAHILGLLLLTLLTALPPLLLVPPTSKPDEIDHWAYTTPTSPRPARSPAFTSPDDPTFTAKRTSRRSTTRWPGC